MKDTLKATMLKEMIRGLPGWDEDRTEIITEKICPRANKHTRLPTHIHILKKTKHNNRGDWSGRHGGSDAQLVICTI